MRDHFAERRGVAVVHQIHAAKLDRIDLQLTSHQIGLALARKNRLQMTRRAHVAARHLVGVNVFFFDQTVGHPIRPRRIMSAN